MGYKNETQEGGFIKHWQGLLKGISEDIAKKHGIEHTNKWKLSDLDGIKKITKLIEETPNDINNLKYDNIYMDYLRRNKDPEDNYAKYWIWGFREAAVPTDIDYEKDFNKINQKYQNYLKKSKENKDEDDIARAHGMEHALKIKKYRTK